MKSSLIKTILFLFVGILSSCNSKPDKGYIDSHIVRNCTPNLEDTIQKYLFLGHIYYQENKIDPRVERMNICEYNRILLGGDLCTETTKNKATIDYLKDVLMVDKPFVYWAVGNHDLRNGHAQWITEATNRPLYYATYFNGITLVVLNTELNQKLPKTDSLCKEINEQFNFINSVNDTIEKSSHLIILSHLLYWSDIDSTKFTEELANAYHTRRFMACNPIMGFRDAIYPSLIETHNKGIEVILLAGDVGQKRKAGALQTKEGIWLLGAGFGVAKEERFSGEKDKMLVFKHNILTRNLTWDFVEVENN